MSKILVSGLVNTETTVKISGFPIEYYPIDYPFFGIGTRVSGVGYNVAKALRTLRDDVAMVSMLGRDVTGALIKAELQRLHLSAQFLCETLRATPSSVVLYDESGRRQVYCDLKDIQEQRLTATAEMLAGRDCLVACNINFSRALLAEAKREGITIATDVHVLHDIDDAYNREFMECADILFLSDEGLPCTAGDFIRRLAEKYGSRIIVLGQGAGGAMLYERGNDCLLQFSAVYNAHVVNTVGAGDALFSAFLHYYCKGLSAVESLKRAEIFASVKIGSDGASEGFPEEATVEAKCAATTFSITEV